MNMIAGRGPSVTLPLCGNMAMQQLAYSGCPDAAIYSPCTTTLARVPALPIKLFA